MAKLPYTKAIIMTTRTGVNLYAKSSMNGDVLELSSEDPWAVFLALEEDYNSIDAAADFAEEILKVVVELGISKISSDD